MYGWLFVTLNMSKVSGLFQLGLSGTHYFITKNSEMGILNELRQQLKEKEWMVDFVNSINYYNRPCLLTSIPGRNVPLIPVQTYGTCMHVLPVGVLWRCPWKRTASRGDIFQRSPIFPTVRANLTRDTYHRQSCSQLYSRVLGMGWKTMKKYPRINPGTTTACFNVNSVRITL